MPRNRIHAGLALLLFGVLLLAGGLEKLERHDHGPLEPGHACAACQIAGAPADLPVAVAAATDVPPPAPGSLLSGSLVHVPDAPVSSVLRLRGPPIG